MSYIENSFKKFEEKETIFETEIENPFVRDTCEIAKILNNAYIFHKVNYFNNLIVKKYLF